MNDASELLYGIKTIARFLELSPRQTQHLHDTGQLPTFKLGRIICARKPTINAHFARIEADSQESDKGKCA